MALLPDLKEYDVVGRLAVGGMAEIYLARANGGRLVGQDLVLKRLLPLHRANPAYIELFLAEARLGALVVHPNIVRTHDLFREGRDYFIVQELVGGDTLAHLRETARARGQRLSLVAALVAFTDLLEALRYLHSGAGIPGHPPIIHRDVNPDNVVAAPEGVAKLIDFGIAEPQAGADTPRAGTLRGTPAYMSPEQVKDRPLDIRSDLFSAGVLLWEVLANRPLFQQDSEFETLRHVCEVTAPPLRTIDPSMPTAFERLCVRALTREKERRFSSAEEFLDTVRAACDREGILLDRKALSDEVRALAPSAPRVGRSAKARVGDVTR